jgi:hypothetical protein
MIKVGDIDVVGNLSVVLESDISFTVDCIGKPRLMFWLTKDQADKLAFQIGSALQDHDLKTLKAGDELREINPIELEGKLE